MDDQKDGGMAQDTPEDGASKPREKKQRSALGFSLTTGSLAAVALAAAQIPAVRDLMSRLRDLSPSVHTGTIIFFAMVAVFATVLFLRREEQLAEMEQVKEDCDELRSDVETAARENAELIGRITELNRAQHGLSHELKEANKRLDAVINCDDHWFRTVRSAAPAFVPPGERGGRTRFLTFVNFKGGVGKTTMAANLGYVLARTGKRVLLVDLDFQGSLSRICVDRMRLPTYETARFSSDRLLDYAPDEDLAKLVDTLSQPFDHRDSEKNRVIIARQDLARTEFREEARWLVHSAPGAEEYEIDTRFRLRNALHRPGVFGRFDYVLFDCPPRLTTACVNALTCSDHLLIPVQLDQQAIESIPRTLGLLERFIALTPANVLGIVGNMASMHGGKLRKVSQRNYDLISHVLRFSGHKEIPVFESAVPYDVAITEGALNREPASKSTDLFDPLAAELHERLAADA